MIHPESSRCVYVVDGVWAFLCGVSTWTSGWAKDTMRTLTQHLCSFLLWRKWAFFLLGNFCLFSVSWGLQEMIRFYHSFTCQAFATIFQRLLFFHLSALVLEHGYTDPAWVKCKEKIGTGKSKSPFLTKMKHVLDFSPSNLSIDSSCLSLAVSLCFRLWVLSIEQYLLYLFYVFHFKHPITFSWVLQRACWPNNSLIFNFHYYLCLKLCHLTPGPQNAYEWQRRSSLTGRADIIWELSHKCRTNVISSCSGAFVRHVVLDLVVVSPTTVAQLFCSSEMLAQPRGARKVHYLWVYRSNGPETFLSRSVPLSLSVTANAHQ